jgi:hypothetical protein
VGEEDRMRVFEGRVMRKICGASREELTRDWRKLHKEEHHDLYCSPYFILVINSRRMRWAGHEGKKKCIQNFGDKHQEKKALGRATLLPTLKKCERTVWAGFIWLGWEQTAGRSGNGNELSGSTKCGNCLTSRRTGVCLGRCSVQLHRYLYAHLYV